MMPYSFHFHLPNFLLKFENCKNQKSILGEVKVIFQNFQCKIIGDTRFEYEQR